MLQELGKPLLSECWLESLNQTVKVWCLSTWLLCHLRNEKEKENSGVCEKPFQVIVTEDPAPNDNFFIGSKFIPSSPTSPPPSNVLPPKKFSSKFNFVLGGRGGVTRFTNITGKVPTLLTSIVEPKCVPQVFLGLLPRTGASNSPRK